MPDVDCLMQSTIVNTSIDQRTQADWKLIGEIPKALCHGAIGISLMMSDTVALLVAGWLGVYLWNLIHPTIDPRWYWGLWPVVVVFLTIYFTLGLYPGAGLNPVEEFRSLTLGTTIGYLASGASIFLSKAVGIPSRGAFVSSWLCTVMLAPLCRALSRSWFARKPWWGVPVLVLGSEQNAKAVIERLQANPEAGLRPVACLEDGATQTWCAGIPVLGPVSLAPELSRSLGVRHAVVATSRTSRGELLELLERMAAVFPHLIVIPDLFGVVSLWVSPRDLSGILSLEVRQNLLVPMNRRLKRLLDLSIACFVGVMALPLLGVLMLWIWCVSRGPVFYKQRREGENGLPFYVYKLRTMHEDAERLLEQHLAANPRVRQEWQQYYKLKDDPRILPGIGRILRRTSLDELPQLWNVIKGEMSLVGPRPLPDYHLNRFSTRFRALRNRVLPGLTGLWQVTSRSNGDLSVQEALDTYYIRNWSLWLDLYILARTVRAVISGQGAY